MDLSETVVPDVSVDREELTNVCFHILIQEFLEGFFHISRDDVFSVVWLISLEKTDWIVANILSQMYLYTR